MNEVYIIGVGCSVFGKRPKQSFKALTREIYLATLADAGLADGLAIDMAWFANCGMHSWGQNNIRGQVCLAPLQREQLLAERMPIINVEGACASGSLALHGAWKDVLSGQAELSLAIGVEKTFHPEAPEKTLTMLAGGIDNLDPDEWQSYYRRAGEAIGQTFMPGLQRSIYMDTYAMQARYHMQKYGTTRRQLAMSAAKAHCYGALNPKAQYRFTMTPEQVLEDYLVSDPLTRAMCAPISDGAAAALLCSEKFLRSLPQTCQRRAVRVAASVLSGGKYRAYDEPGLSRIAANKAYAQAGVKPCDIHVAEVHDATSFCEIYQVEMLGFCAQGEGGSFVESGATALDGAIPINTSGGLVAKGHPIGATGLSMIYELVQQLRNEADNRQVANAHRSLAENAGGVMGFDEAVCSVVILEGNVRRAHERKIERK